MTKSMMISKIQQKEYELWLELAEYDYENKPVFGDVKMSMEWDATNPERRNILHAWSEIKQLMEEMEIEALFNDAACNLNNQTWKRERDAREIV